MTTSNTISVTGYFEGGCCCHCGRELRHCVQTDAGTFGAACFATRVTKPRTYRGKSYRLSAGAVVALAKAARSPDWNLLDSLNFTFEAA